MELLQIKRTEINIGLKKEYRFLQVSDMHLAYSDEKSSQIDACEHKRCRQQWEALKFHFAKENNEFCDERYNIEPYVLFEALCKHALEINADALILSGDMMDRVTDSSIRYLKSIISSLPIPVIYCLGNHCYSNENGEHLNQYDRLKDIAPNPEFNSIDFGEFEFLTFDNNEQITNSQLEFLKEKIASNKKLLLVEHKPLLLGEFGEKLLDKIGEYFFIGTEKDEENTKEFVNLIRENSDRFIAVLCGHIHSAKEYKITENLMQISTSSGLIGACREIIIK